MNVNDHGLKFTMSHSHESVTFLDVLVKTTPENKLTTTLFCKSTAGNTVLDATSFHTTSLKNSIPYRQYLRLRRNCSTDAFFKEAGLLQDCLLSRGYSRSCLKKAYNKAMRQSRAILLPKPKPRDSSNPTRIIMRFSRQHVTVKNILQKHWSILTDDPTLKTLLPKQPSITFRRATSLKDMLVQSEFKDQYKRFKQCHVTGSFPCGHCTFCPLIKKAKSFRIPNG